MASRGLFHKCLTLVVLFVTVVATTPLSASDFASKAILGSVSAVGAVDLRGIRIAQDGTIFPGDQLNVGEKGYAKIIFVNGHKAELGEKTNVSVGRQGKGIEFATLKSEPMHVSAGGFEIAATQPAAGHVAVIANDLIGVRVVNGTDSDQ